MILTTQNWLRSQDSNLAMFSHALGLTVRGFRLATTSGIILAFLNHLIHFSNVITMSAPIPTTVTLE